MGVNPFVHLHVHSQYSLLEASTRLDKMVTLASAYGMPAVALTDNGNMFGAVEFYFAAMDAGLKPIIGLDVYLAHKSRLIKGEDRDAASQPNRRLVLLAQSFAGYQNLCKISSIGYQEGFYYKPRIDQEVLQSYGSDLLVLSGNSRGEIASTLTRFGPEAALERVREMQKLFPERFYLELNRTGTPEWAELNKFLLEAARITGVPVVATNNVHYLHQEDQIAQEVLICIGSNKTIHDESRFRLGSDQFFFKSSEAMRTLFQDIPEACDRTLEIAERIQLKFKLKDTNGKTIYHLPTFVADEKLRTPFEQIREMADSGLEVRYQEANARGEAVLDSDKPHYVERLNYELGVIEKMGFTSYFLIVQDFINWAKNNGIPVGPGRGSGAGSLVAYALRITDLDPVRHKLIFERFLNPERISMPDFDIDFCQEKRGLVIDYVTQKYGRGQVSQIITFGKLQARAAIRDVGRVLGMSYADVDVISKLMPDKLGLTIEEALELEPRIKEQIDVNPQVATLIELARKIEGLVRHAGIHAAGVVIASDELVKHAPLYRGADDENVVQYDMKFAEKIGLIKFDFLGLKTLTHIQNALDLIESNQGKKILPSEIPVSDPGIYEIMSKGDTAGIFQFEGDGITDTVKKIRPSCFEDITAINALYRPGPMDMIPEYTARMHGEKKIEYLLPELEELLKETYGIIIYQEQVMSISSRIANYTLGEADMLRRAMGKKIASEMDAQKERFMRGAAENGFETKKAGQLFDLMKEFANYGFNKSHAAAYCVIAAQTAWLKRYYPVEFYAALLSTEMSNTENVVRYIKDIKGRGINIEAPHINQSNYQFTVRGQTIFFSLGAIKGVGEGAVESIVTARNLLHTKRENSGADFKFKNLEEFFESIDGRKVNKKTIECLIKAGSLDGFGPHRAQLLSGFEKYLERASTARIEREIGQGSLFSMMTTNANGDDGGGGSQQDSGENVTLDETTPWNRSLGLTFEKEVLGFYLSNHPMGSYANLHRKWITCDIADLNLQDQKKRVIVAGLANELREIITKKGTRMAFAQLEDMTGQVELVVFPDTYVKSELPLKTEFALIVGGTLEKEDGNCKILVDRVSLLDDVIKKSKQVVLKLDQQMLGDFDRLGHVFRKFPGMTGIELEIELPDLKRVVTMNVTDPNGIDASQAFFEDIHSVFGRTDFIEIRI